MSAWTNLVIDLVGDLGAVLLLVVVAALPVALGSWVVSWGVHAVKDYLGVYDREYDRDFPG